jgi:hypothetical protein
MRLKSIAKCNVAKWYSAVKQITLDHDTPTEWSVQSRLQIQMYFISHWTWKQVYRALPPLLEYPWPHFKRQLTVPHSFCYHGHLGRPHTGGAPAPLCECTNSRTHVHRNWYCRIKKQNKKKLSGYLNFRLYRTTITYYVHFTCTPTSFSAHAHLPCTALRYRISPQRL